jgi:rubrerythrin
MFVFGTADDVFTMAVRIEENGNAFYAGAAQMYLDGKIKELFQELAQMEEGHIAAFKKLRSNLPGSVLTDTVWDPEGLAESYLQATADTHIFTVEAAKDRLKTVKTPVEALDMALEFEKDSVSFFVGMKEILPDAGSKNEIDKLIRAEMEHVKMLLVAKKQLLQSGSATIR